METNEETSGVDFKEMAQVISDAGITWMYKGEPVSLFDMGGILLVASAEGCPVTAKIISHALDNPGKDDVQLISDCDDILEKHFEEDMNINGRMN